MYPLIINLGPFQCKASCLLTLYRELNCDWRLFLPRTWDFQVELYGSASFLAGSQLPRQIIQQGAELFGCTVREYGGSDWKTQREDELNWRIITTDMYFLDFNRHYQTNHFIHFVLLRLIDNELVEFIDPLLGLHRSLNIEMITRAFVSVEEAQLRIGSVNYGSYLTITSPYEHIYSDQRARYILTCEIYKLHDHYISIAKGTIERLAQFVACLSIDVFAETWAAWLLEHIAHLPTAREFFSHLFTMTDLFVPAAWQQLRPELTEIVKLWWRSMYLLSRFNRSMHRKEQDDFVTNLYNTAQKEEIFIKHVCQWLSEEIGTQSEPKPSRK